MVVVFGTFHGIIFFPALINLYAVYKERRGEGITRGSFKREIDENLLDPSQINSIERNYDPSKNTKIINIEENKVNKV